MRFFQAECFGDNVGDRVQIRVAPTAASPWVDPEAIVPGEVSIERILAGDNVIKAPDAKTLSNILRRIIVGNRTPVGTIGCTGQGPEEVRILEHRRLQTGNGGTHRHRRTVRTQGITGPCKTLAGVGAWHNRSARTR